MAALGATGDSSGFARHLAVPAHGDFQERASQRRLRAGGGRDDYGDCAKEKNERRPARKTGKVHGRILWAPIRSVNALTSSGRKGSLHGEHVFANHHPAEEEWVLTPRQREIWDYLRLYVDEHGYPPTVREIGQAVGLASPSTVHAHLANLERAGLLKRDPTKPRALELLAREREQEHKLPLLGQVAAGSPLLAEENIEEYLAVPEPLSRGGQEFLLRVRGDSMINAGILDADILVVRRQETVENGEIAVVLAGEDESAGEATAKRFFREHGRIRLQPENDALEPIYADYVQVLGKVTGVFRTLT